MELRSQPQTNNRSDASTKSSSSSGPPSREATIFRIFVSSAFSSSFGEVVLAHSTRPADACHQNHVGAAAVPAFPSSPSFGSASFSFFNISSICVAAARPRSGRAGDRARRRRRHEAWRCQAAARLVSHHQLHLARRHFPGEDGTPQCLEPDQGLGAGRRIARRRRPPAEGAGSSRRAGGRGEGAGSVPSRR